MTIQPIQNINNSALNVSPSLQNKLNVTDANAVASPTPVVAGAPPQVQQQNGDSVEISTKKEKKFDPTLLLAFLIGITVSTIPMLFGKKTKIK